jgi:hypothetical protein
MHRKKRKAQIRQRQLKRKKNVSFKLFSAEENREIAKQKKSARGDVWKYRKDKLDADTLVEVESQHGMKFKPLLKKLRAVFSDQKIEVLDEGSGKSSLKEELMEPKFGGNLHITTTDVRSGRGWPDKVVNVTDLVKEFGKNKFHFAELERRLNFSIKKRYADSILFTKNIGRRKKG